MDVKKIDDNHISITASKKEWAGLAELMEWVLTEGGAMDGATTFLEAEEIPPMLRKWQEIASIAITQ